MTTRPTSPFNLPLRTASHSPRRAQKEQVPVKAHTPRLGKVREEAASNRDLRTRSYAVENLSSEELKCGRESTRKDYRKQVIQAVVVAAIGTLLLALAATLCYFAFAPKFYSIMWAPCGTIAPTPLLKINLTCAALNSIGGLCLFGLAIFYFPKRRYHSEKYAQRVIQDLKESNFQEVYKEYAGRLDELRRHRFLTPETKREISTLFDTYRTNPSNTQLPHQWKAIQNTLKSPKSDIN